MRRNENKLKWDEYPSTLTMEAARPSEKFVSIYQTPWRHIPEHNNLRGNESSG
jgi:hypothetical protein